MKRLGLNSLAEISRQLHADSVVSLLVIILMQVNSEKVQAGPKKHKRKVSSCIKPKSIMAESSLVPSEEKSLRKGLRRNSIQRVVPAWQDSPRKASNLRKGNA